MKLEWPHTFLSPTQSDFPSTVQKHLLPGLAYLTLKEEQFKSNWKKQWIHNELKLQILQDLSPKLRQRNITPILLKGTDLLLRLYKDHGSRFMADIDILLPKEQLESLSTLLHNEGFKIIKEQKWYGNKHKKTFNKIFLGNEIIIECHTKFLYHTNIWPNTEASPLDGFAQLEINTLFLYLCGHYAFQHNFLKLYWLFDIYYLAQNFDQQLSSPAIIKLAKKYKLENALIDCCYILKKHFNLSTPLTTSTPLPSQLKQKFLTKELLIADKQNSWHYLLRKNLNHDSLIDLLNYNLRWIKAKLAIIP